MAGKKLFKQGRTMSDFIFLFIATHPQLATALILTPWAALAVVAWTDFLEEDDDNKIN